MAKVFPRRFSLLWLPGYSRNGRLTGCRSILAMRSNCRPAPPIFSSMLASLGSGGPVTTRPPCIPSAPRANRPMCAEQAMPQFLSGPLPNVRGSARSTAEPPAHRSNQKTLSVASSGNVPSYDRTEVLLNTIAWWSDDDGATADAFLAAGCARLVHCRLGLRSTTTGGGSALSRGVPAAIMRRMGWRHGRAQRTRCRRPRGQAGVAALIQ
jgi:hypothetical protein